MFQTQFFYFHVLLFMFLDQVNIVKANKFCKLRLL